ncbi:MAG TPA: hypothetical protein VMF30_03560, partial [Pirellulales bacterium]|nr:hypothetical protein [Pirellulales bacterium]
MITGSPGEQIVRAARAATNKAIERRAEQFAPKLRRWLSGIFTPPIRADWREELAAFVARTADEDKLRIAPRSVEALERLISSRTRDTGTERAAGDPQSGQMKLLAAPARKGSAPKVAGQPKATDPSERFVGYPKIPENRRYFRAEPLFDGKLDSARQHLAAIKQLLDSVAAKLGAAKPEQEVGLDDEAAAIRQHLFLYNEDVAVASDLWLRFQLSSDAAAKLAEMHTPVDFGLPAFANEQQAARARHQSLEINRRLQGQLASMDRVIATMQTVELAANAASIAAGAGMVVVAAKQGGKWAAVKLVATGVALYGADRAGEFGLRAAGASDQTIAGVRLAGAVITLILLGRIAKRPTAGEPPVEPPVEPTGPAEPTPPAEKAPSTVKAPIREVPGAAAKPSTEPLETPPQDAPAPRPEPAEPVEAPSETLPGAQPVSGAGPVSSPPYRGPGRAASGTERAKTKQPRRPG